MSTLFAKIKPIFRDINTSFYRNFDHQPLKTQNGPFHTYCINIYRIIHQNEKGLTLYSIIAPFDAFEISCI